MKHFSPLALIIALIFTIIFTLPDKSLAANYALQKIGDGIYAAEAQLGSKTASNALVIIGRTQVLLAGAHFVAEGITELIREVGNLTPLPIRAVVLTHHHKGYSFIDFDFPATIELIMSWQTWQAMNSERRDLKNNISFFNTDMTLVRDNVSIVLTNTELGHTAGDVIMYLPTSRILFASDLVFNNAVGFMGDGNMREWVLNLERLEELGAATVVPGVGKPGSATIITEFKEFFRDFLTEVIQLKTTGRSISQAKKEFALAAKYKKLPGYTTFLNPNLERAYNDPSIQ